MSSLLSNSSEIKTKHSEIYYQDTQDRILFIYETRYPLSKDKINKTINGIIKDTERLRTTFRMEKSNEYSIIHNAFDYDCHVDELTDETLNRYMNQEIPLSELPLFKTVILNSKKTYVLLFNFSKRIMNQRLAHVFGEQFSQIYNGLGKTDKTLGCCRSYSIKQGNSLFYTDQNRMSDISRAFPMETSSNIFKYCSRKGANPFFMLFTAFSLAVKGCFDYDDYNIQIPLQSDLMENESHFLTIPMDIDRDNSFSELYHENVAKFCKNYFSLKVLQEIDGVIQYCQIIERNSVIFSVGGPMVLSLDNHVLEPIPSISIGRAMDINFNVWERNGVFRWRCDSFLYQVCNIDFFIERFFRILNIVSSNDNTLVKELLH